MRYCGRLRRCHPCPLLSPSPLLPVRGGALEAVDANFPLPIKLSLRFRCHCRASPSIAPLIEAPSSDPIAASSCGYFAFAHRSSPPCPSPSPPPSSPGNPSLQVPAPVPPARQRPREGREVINITAPPLEGIRRILSPAPGCSRRLGWATVHHTLISAKNHRPLKAPLWGGARKSTATVTERCQTRVVRSHLPVVMWWLLATSRGYREILWP